MKGSREEIESWEAQFKLSSKILKEKFLQPDAIMSFAPLRKSTQTRWLLCGQAYYYRLAEAIRQATQEVYICGWWFRNEIDLLRNGQSIEDLLIEKAKNNVKIFILVYGNMEKMLSIGNYAGKSCEIEILYLFCEKLTHSTLFVQL